MIKNGVYKLSRRIANSSGCTNHRLWTSCAHFPPAEDEWDGSPAWSLEEFVLVVRGTEILGRKYKELMLMSAAWTTGFFIGEVPCKEHFPTLDEDEIDEYVYGEFQSHSEVPAPQELFEAMVPAKGKTLEEVMLMWARYEGIDPRHRLDKDNWASTFLAVVRHECRSDPKFFEKFVTGVRRLLVRDGNRSLVDPSTVLYTEGKIDEEKTAQYHRERLEELKQINLKQHRAFMQLDRDERIRKNRDHD